MRTALLTTLATIVAAPALPAAEVDYVREVKPILSAHCYTCHSAVRQKSGLRLDAASLIRKGGKHGPAVVPGKSAASLLMQALLGADRPRMPPESEGAALSDKDVAVLRAWIDQGANAPDEPVPDDPRNHWAFRPPVHPVLPRLTGAGPVRNPIDAFVAAEWARHGLTPNPPADRTTLLRRVYLDLVGLPPTREDLHAFLADSSPDAYEKVVDRLLASPQYGERWGRHWLDVWRYSDPFGLGEEYRYSQRHIWRWRDWVIESLNADKGYDRMIVEMLAGDEVAPADRDTLRATGFLARNWYKFNRNAWLQDTVEHTAAGFLGITLRCARCHDHKYDPISQQDYYRFRAFFEPHDIRIDPLPGQPDVMKDGVARAFEARSDAPTYLFVRGDDRNPDKEHPLTPGVPAALGGEARVEPVKFTPRDFAASLGPAAEEALRRTRGELAMAGDGVKATRARAVLAAVEARVAAERAKFADPPDPAARTLALAAGKAERQAAALAAREALLRAEEAVAAARAASQDAAGKKALADAEQKLAAARKALADAQAAAEREDPSYTPLVVVNPTGSTGRRLALARWVTRRDNPLTARVAVNQVWMRHFGKPLVPTVVNFGLNGKQPTHPELLDFLAVQFMEDGWSMKKLHRLIVTSHTYRLASVSARPLAANLAADPENRYLWGMNARRMEGEVVRDSLLAVAGELDARQGGPILDEKLGQTSHRRSIYFRFNTEYKMMFLDQFDPASPTECYERRESVVPQQALALHNSALALSQSRLLAKRLAASPEGAGASAFVTAGFEQVLGRAPTAEERTRCERFLSEQAALLKEPGKLTAFPAGPDAVVPPSGDPAQRARENLILVLFNHNDFVTIR
ncbi:MAG TPA: PSD1 and planctomycete cytochrome C domain-containing protein [Gemmataceae bacterium]|nr:PSD1 and planctomycete cytochrome C domain-containing protein [Gemmataceae bacterium]